MRASHCFLLAICLLLWGVEPAEAATCGSPSGGPAKGGPASGGPAKGSFRFPALKVRYTQVKKRWNLYLRSFNFTSLVGKRPFVLLYFVPNHGPSEKQLKAFDAASKKYKGKLDFLAVAPIRRYRDIRRLYKRLKQLKIQLPVLLDDRKLLAYVTLSRRAPSYAAINRSGFVRLTNAASLKELVAPKTSLLSVLGRLAKGKDFPYTKAPGFSPNPFAHVGRKAFPFRLPRALASGTTSMKDILKAAKHRPVLLLFWTIRCVHCRRLLPVLQRYAKGQRKHFRVWSIVQADKSRQIKQLKSFLRRNKIQLPLLLSARGKIFDKYNALLTPTLLLFNKAGILRAVHMGSRGKIATIVQKMLEQIRPSG